MDIKDVIIKRSSCRKYLEKAVSDEIINDIVEAGRLAPCGGNNQSCHFIVITNKDVLNKLIDLTTLAFSKMEIDDKMYKSKKTSINLSKKGPYHFFYDAPVLIIVANQKEYGNALVDSACALENMMLVTTSNNLGSCYINQLHWLNDDINIREYLESLGLSSNGDICGSLAIGYPALELKQKKITGNPVTFVK